MLVTLVARCNILFHWETALSSRLRALSERRRAKHRTSTSSSRRAFHCRYLFPLKKGGNGIFPVLVLIYYFDCYVGSTVCCTTNGLAAYRC